MHFFFLANNLVDSGSRYHMRLLWRHRRHDKKGERKVSQQYATIAEAEDNAFEYRYSLESKNSKQKIDKIRSDFILGLDEASIINELPIPSSKCSRLTTSRKEAYRMSDSKHLNIPLIA